MARSYGSPVLSHSEEPRKGQLVVLEVRHSLRARCEDGIHNAKDTGVTNPGRASPRTARSNSSHFQVLSTRYILRADIAQERIAHDAASEGGFPLITCDRDPSDADMLDAYRYYPHLEGRQHRLKSVPTAAPVLLHSQPWPEPANKYLLDKMTLLRPTTDPGDSHFEMLSASFVIQKI